MKTTPLFTPARVVSTLLLGGGLLLGTSGCSTTDSRYSSYDRYERPVRVVQQDTYVYYPAYEVYYNQARGTYVYYDTGRWITSRSIPRRWSRDLPRSPSVYLDFRDAPERHHAEIARQYPRNWHGQQRRAGRPDYRDDRWNDRNDRH